MRSSSLMRLCKRNTVFSSSFVRDVTSVNSHTSSFGTRVHGPQTGRYMIGSAETIVTEEKFKLTVPSHFCQKANKSVSKYGKIETGDVQFSNAYQRASQKLVHLGAQHNIPAVKAGFPASQRGRFLLLSFLGIIVAHGLVGGELVANPSRNPYNGGWVRVRAIFCSIP